MADIIRGIECDSGYVIDVDAGPLQIADIDATGTPDGMTVLVGDGSWNTIAGILGYTPADDAALTGGTVTSVNLTAPAAGITASGGPVTTSGSITLALADDLAALEALSGTNTIYYRSGASAWTAVTIGSGIAFAGGTLSATGTGGTVTSVAASGGTTGLSFSGSPIITSGTLTLSGTLVVANGGTGSTTAAGARSNLGLVIGGDVQAFNANLTHYSALSTDGFVVARTTFGAAYTRTLTGTANRVTITYGDGIVGDPVFDIAATYVGQTSITTLGTITAGTWTGTTIAVANGGTGATSAGAARTNLGLVIGTDVQAFSVTLAAVAGGTYTGAASITTLGTIGTGTWNGSIITSAYGGTGNGFTKFTGPTTSEKTFTLPNATCTILTTNAAVTVAQGGTGGTDASTARTNLGVAIGTDVQAYDSDLAAVAGLSSTGLIARTGSGMASVRTITAPAAGIGVSNGDGVSGNPTLSLANDLAALEGLSSTGIAVRTASDTWAQRTITAGSLIGMTDGNGVSGNPTIAVNITGATGNTSPVDADELPHYQVSSTTNKKVTIGNLRKLITPPGAIVQYGGGSAPSGWLECDGSAVSRSTYADLYSAIGTAFGSGDGSTTFNLPDFRRRAAVGKGGTGTGTLANSTGSTGGAETHTLSTAESPAHTHGANSSAQFFLQRHNSGGLSFNTTTGAGALDGFLSTTGSTGGGGSHNNLQPSLVVMFLIKT